jgi:hypothetical protein
MDVEAITEVLENELRNAFEVKNEQSLHRYVRLLSENIVSKARHSEEFESLKSENREILTVIREGFKRMDERFEAVDKRFEIMQHSMDDRFEAVDKRFEVMQHNMDKRFEAVDKRFEAVDKRFDDVNRRFDMQFRFTTIGFTLLAVLMTVYQFLR